MFENWSVMSADVNPVRELRTQRMYDRGLNQNLKVDSYRRQESTTFSNGVKGDAYEGLLKKNAQDTKSGAG